MSFSIINYNHQMAVHSQVKNMFQVLWVATCSQSFSKIQKKETDFKILLGCLSFCNPF